MDGWLQVAATQLGGYCFGISCIYPTMEEELKSRTVVDMKEQSGLDVSTSTIQKALHGKGLRPYRKQWEFILDAENRNRVFCSVYIATAILINIPTKPKKISNVDR